MRIDVLSLFPDLITNYCETSILGLALERKLYELNVHNPRDYSEDKHKKVDDTPYGGGSGMLLSPQPFIDCLDNVIGDIEGIDTKQSLLDLHQQVLAQLESNKTGYEIIVTSPSGRPWTQDLAAELSKKSNLIILCGRYEGFDQRIRDRASMEVSMGDYVLTGGELPALVMIDSVLRLLPGVLGDDSSQEYESFSAINYLEECEKYSVSKRELEELLDEVEIKKESLESLKLLEYPHYTKPADFRGEKVPEVLQQGDHKKIFLWRLLEAIKLTKEKRPDLLR